MKIHCKYPIVYRILILPIWCVVYWFPLYALWWRDSSYIFLWFMGIPLILCGIWMLPLCYMVCLLLLFFVCNVWISPRPLWCIVSPINLRSMEYPHFVYSVWIPHIFYTLYGFPPICCMVYRFSIYKILCMDSPPICCVVCVTDFAGETHLSLLLERERVLITF